MNNDKKKTKKNKSHSIKEGSQRVCDLSQIEELSSYDMITLHGGAGVITDPPDSHYKIHGGNHKGLGEG